MKYFLIIVPEEFAVTNHKELFYNIAEMVGANTRVVVVDVPADALVTRLNHKYYRLIESRGNAERMNDNLFRIRPFFLVRPEIVPVPVLPIFARSFWSQMKRSFPDIMVNEVRVLCYDLSWFPLLAESHPNIVFAYYITDEWRLIADSDKVDKRAVKLDDYACKLCKALYVASPQIKKTRETKNTNIYVTGNGATLCSDNNRPFAHFSRSVGFVGHFRDWIDVSLLRDLIASKRDVFFAFLGKIQPKMESVLLSILDEFDNTAYFGKVKKEDVSGVYRMFDCIMVPYIQNVFMQNTRPIKIVEAVFAGTPVVSIPVGGYRECSFIRFATDARSFGDQIDFLMEHPIDRQSDEYLCFVKENSWTAIAQTILDTLNR